MKKLFLLLFAICISVMGWAQTTLNPYAYDLSSSWDPTSRKLTLSFKLNTKPNTDTSDKRGGAGMMVRLVDSKGNRYNVIPVSGADINSKVCGPYTYTIDFASGKNPYGNALPNIPTDDYLTWEVRVCGEDRNSELGRKDIATSDIQNAGWRPYSTHGVAIGKNYNSTNYGKIFVTESSDTKPSGWDWLEGRIPSLLEYDPMKFTSTSTSDYAIARKKTHQNSPTSAVSNFSNPEPHRVRISDDGRIFVTSYHYNSTTSVWEYVGNGQYNQLILHDKGAQNRIVAMDVKGSGPDLKLLLCEVVPDKGTYSNSSQHHGQLVIREYAIGTSTNTRTVDSGTPKAYYNDYRTGTTLAGLLYQSFNGQKWSLYNDGLINIAYGKGNAIWLKVDFYIDTTTKSRIIYYDGTNTGENYKDDKGNTTTATPPSGIKITPLPVISNGYGGGDGLLVKGDTLITAGTDRIYFYPIASDGALGIRTELNTINSDFHSTLNWVNDFALDPAHNLYAISASARNLIAIPLPYDGVTTTPAPDNSKFILSDPVPNILATDLRLEINNSNQYTFSFNTNTKPEEAEIRFYSSYDAMKNSLNVVNADNYNGNNANKPTCIYKIPNDKLKQGRIEVTLGGVGGEVSDGVITNDRIPAGELYWSVYVKTRKSNVFAPTCRLEGVTDTQGEHRRYATVNNYPETDMFGSIIVADCPTVNSVNGPYNGLMIYGINPEGNSNDEQNDISNSVRYSHRASYLNSGVASASDKLNFPRRLVVAPDGRVFIADQGTTDVADYAGATSIVQHERGGVRLWDPKDPNKFTLFSHNKIGTSFGISLWEHSAANGGVKIYAANAYEEYLKHNSSNNYTDAQKNGIFGWNGFAEYTLNAHPNGSATWDKPDSVHYALGRGDASGNYSLVAMDKGVWMCQHREHTRKLKDDALQPLADNLDGVLISFFPYGATRNETWNSCTSNGVINYDNASKRTESADASDLTQKLTSPIQSTPGAGMAYRKIDGKDYLFVVNHDGNIAQILIEGWTGSGSTATPIIDASKVKILVTPEDTKGDREVTVVGGTAQWHTAFITTMSFDYAGNLVTTTGKSFGHAHDIIVYTMPYDRTNAREIQAPNSCRMIRERLAYLDMSAQELGLVINNHKDHDGCAIELFRPLQEGMFNTICLPFTLDFATLPADHPLKNAEVRAFTGVALETIGGEKVLSLVFSDITNGATKVMEANVPYLLQPVADIAGSMRFDNPVQLTSITGNSVRHNFDTDNNITFKGVIPITPLEANPLTLLLVANNRLAELSSNTNMLGFRGYFQLAKDLEPGTTTKIVGKKPVTTNTTIVVDGKKVNVEKYLREGRVYIRVGETLYTIDGVKVE